MRCDSPMRSLSQAAGHKKEAEGHVAGPEGGHWDPRPLPANYLPTAGDLSPTATRNWTVPTV